MKKRIFYIICICLWSYGCGDFLSEKSLDQSYVTSCEDLDELLVGRGYMEATHPVSSSDGTFLPCLHVMDDDVQEARSSRASALDQLEPLHHWAQEPNMTSLGNESKDNNWPKIYDHINIANILLAQANHFSDDPESERIKGECYFLRANCYFLLVNLYAKPYVKENAGTDPGVPVKLTEYVEDIHYARHTVAEVYDRIVSDLKEAVSCLEGKNGQLRGKYQAGEAAARALLSRVYLYMGEYALSLEQSTHSVFDSYTLADLNTFTSFGQFLQASSPELIFTQGAYNCSYLHSTGFAVSDELMEAYGPGDRRRACFFSSGSSHSKSIVAKGMAYDSYPVSDVTALRLGEVVLNRAEAYALSGKEELALEAIETLRAKRFKTGSPLVDESLTGRALIDEIRKERRLELCFEGHRWFDLRRYAVHPQYPHSESIYHDHFELSGRNPVYAGYYELKPYEEETAYVLPLPDDALVFNEGVLVDNEPRPERVMIEEPRN